MGASSSMVTSRDHNIEMNIAVEEPIDGHVLMKRHSSQPANAIFANFITRQKHSEGMLRLPAANLRSSGSFDPSATTSVIPTEAVDKRKKEYDTLKFTKEQEIQALQRKEQKLETENSRLRAELQALNKQCQKLRAERDTAMESSYIATERATVLEQDREKIQRQFKIFRETKESEIQALLQAKRQLESKFHRLQAHGMATIDDQNFSGENHQKHLINPGEHFRDENEWWATPESENTSIFGSCAQLQTGSNAGYPDSFLGNGLDSRKPLSDELGLPNNFSSTTEKDNWLTATSSLANVLPITDVSDLYDNTIFRCYVCTTPDVYPDARAFISHPDLHHLKYTCEKEGYFLSVIHFTDLEEYSIVWNTNESTLSHCDTVRYAISNSTVFIAFVGTELGKYTLNECEEGHFKSPQSKSTLFCIKNTSENKHERATDSLIHQAQSSSSSRCLFYNSSSEASSLALREIAKAIRLEFGVRIQEISSSSDGIDPSDVRCIDDMMIDPHMERTQQEIGSMCGNPRNIPPVGMDKCYDRLDEVVTSPGPVPPLLVSGTSGSGKTLLLSSWTTRLRSNRPDVLVLQHFVTNPNSIDAEPVVVLRRLLSQLCQYISPASQPPPHSYSSYDVKRLRETFPRWLEQLSSRRHKRILLVIDSLDLLKDAQRHFSWLLDPLHVGVRVLISVSVDLCPEEWRQFPTLHLEPLSIQSVKLLLKEHFMQRNVIISQPWEKDVLSQCRTATTCHPLYVTLLSALVCSICEGWMSENMFYSCSRKQDSAELYQLFLSDLEMKCINKETRTSLKTILQFIACSRDGLSETEIMLLLPNLSWHTWTTLLRKLSSLCIVKEQAGLVVPHNSEIAKLLYNNYVCNDVHERRYRQKMVNCLLKQHNHFVTPRSTDLLLWLLHKEDEREILVQVLKSPHVFHTMYTRGRNSELVELWRSYLNEEKKTIAQYYNAEMKKLESESGSKVAAMTEVAIIYQSLGRFLKDMGLFEQAVSALQRSLEIQETVLDPDHPTVADSLHHLASVYAHWGKLSTAEPLYRQSLELIQSTAGHEHLRVAQELSALLKIARKTGRNEVAANLQQRIATITQKNGPMISNRMERLKKRALRLEELTLGEDSLKMAQALNDLGVLYHLQHNLENAESFFRRSLKMREKLVGMQHVDVAQSLHNLASVYNEKKNYAKAIECMNGAFEIRSNKLGLSDATLTSTLKYLAILYKKVKNFGKACQVYEQLLEISIDTTGEDSVPTANAMTNLAVSECQLKRLDVALPLYQKALKIYQEVYGRQSPQVSQTLKNIAVLLLEQGRSKEAALVYKETMEENTDRPGPSQTW